MEATRAADVLLEREQVCPRKVASDHRGRAVGARVVDHDRLVGGAALLRESLQTPAQQVPPVVRDDDRAHPLRVAPT